MLPIETTCIRISKYGFYNYIKYKYLRKIKYELLKRYCNVTDNNNTSSTNPILLLNDIQKNNRVFI